MRIVAALFENASVLFDGSVSSERRRSCRIWFNFALVMALLAISISRSMGEHEKCTFFVRLFVVAVVHTVCRYTRVDS